MQAKIILTDSALSILPLRTPHRPRQRFIKYYQDLYARYDKSLSTNVFLSGSQYAYTDLATAVLDNFFKVYQPRQTDVLFIVTWSHEFDPDAVSVAAYLQQRYHFEGKLFDIGDQGVMSFFTCLELVKKYLLHSTAQRAFILVLEQTSVPQHSQSYRQPPSRDFAFLLQLDKQLPHIFSANKRVMVDAGVFEQPPMHAELLDRLQAAGLSAIECARTQWVCQMSSGLASRSMPAAFRRAPTLFPGQLPPCILPFDAGQFSQLCWLHSLVQRKKRKCSQNKCLLIEDRESPAIGYLLLN